VKRESSDSSVFIIITVKVNSELNNNLGNFVNRALTFLHKNFDGAVPEMDLTSIELKLFEEVNRELADYTHLMEEVSREFVAV
jgi:methionyl-tRNA synthetase